MDAMRYNWLFVLPLVAVIAISIATILRFRKKKLRKPKHDNSSLIAHTKTIRELPEYKAAKKHYNMLLCLATALFVVSMSSITVVTSRPVSVEETHSDQKNRDIMLCLDVSGSMSNNINELLDYYKNLVERMQGERFGVTIFDGIYVTLSPLSDDYLAVSEVLQDLKDNFDKYGSALWGAAVSKQHSSSEIGPGLVGCVEAFDRLGEAERSRSIVIATDNYANRSQEVNIKQAAAYARSYDITVYGLNTGEAMSMTNYEGQAESASGKEFREAVLMTGGSYYLFAGSKYSIEEIAEQISQQESAIFEGAGQVVRRDIPKVPAIIAAVSLLLFMFIIWRLKL
ncbi:VWA domain-containing protein [Candidatus Saccharibacteria bacterium]|nr:VWA domain-containing protein [Candidatus Saccharibacteria bacterium]